MTTTRFSVEKQATIDPVELTAANVQAAFARGDLTAEALTQAYLDRIALYNPRYVALITINDDALRDAREIDRRRPAGEPLGPLAGVPIVVKDTMDMAGFPSTGGWRLLGERAGGIDLIPATDSPVVARMRAAGAIILGKTNVPVLSASGSHANNSWAGVTLNVVDPSRLPGGSSAGTATAVAGSFAVLGLGEETGGSIQNPASAQDLVGLKPTFALVPNAGVMPLAGSTRDVVGPIARCVRDAALTLDVLAGFSSEDPKTVAGIGQKPKGGYAAGLDATSLRGKRLGLYGPGWRKQPLSSEATALYQRAFGELEAVLADPLAPPDLSDFLAAKEANLEIFNEIMAREKLDGLVFPQMRDELPPLFGPETVHETSVSEINIAGLPGVTVPAGYYASGAPFGLIFIGPMWSDATLLSFAFDYESATKHRRSPAPLHRH